MTRRLPALIALLVLLVPAGASATGLYKGMGRRTIDYSWTWRANASIGFHGVEDPWDDFGVNSYPIGGVTAFGIERATLRGQSIELHGTFLWVEDREELVVFGPPGTPAQPGSFLYDVSAWSAGATWRFYYQHGASSGYVGFGGAWVIQSGLEYREQHAGGTPYRIEADGQGPELHAVFGVEGTGGQSFRLGLEMGFRYSWVDFDRGLNGAGNFNGFWLARRGSLARR